MLPPASGHLQQPLTPAAPHARHPPPGILLRRLAGDPQLCSTSCVVVDEVHERTCQGDFLMALLREMVARRRAAGRPLKVTAPAFECARPAHRRRARRCAALLQRGLAGLRSRRLLIPALLPPLQVVLMSATLDASLYSGYFGNCPVLSAAGRTHPVEHLFLEDV
jgi:ATP-dependent RNA helicase DHX29